MEHAPDARIVETLRQTGTPIADKDLAHVSPLLHRRVIPNTYHFPRAIEEGNLSYNTLAYVSRPGGLWAGSSATFCLADPGSSVAVRDRNNAVEYLG
jgi:hypothetical protein